MGLARRYSKILKRYHNCWKIKKPQKKPDTFLNSVFLSKLDDTVIKKVTDICRNAETWYDNTIKTLPSIQNSQKIIEKFKDVKNELTLMDVKLANETLKESRQNFTKNAKEIAQNWLYIHDVYRKYPEDAVVNHAYLKYLAKLLASRESRFPVEPYVQNLAKGPFNLESPDFEPTNEQLNHGQTSVSLKAKYINQLKIEIGRLECRYRKRRLMVRLKENVPKIEIIKELLEIAAIDPLDIKTHLLLARMFSEYAMTLKNHQKRTSMREQALKYCNMAFSKIDDYLDLQDIQVMKDRDIQRSGFVKSISAIRIPLIRKR